MAREFVVYGGEKFWIQTSGRYFQSGRKTAPERLLHRRVWIDNNGPIPEGTEIHHLDENWRNNDPKNLEVRSIVKHRREHQLQRMADPEFRALAIQALRDNSHKAAEWHASPEGIEWHRQNGKQAWEKRESTQKVCVLCSKPFEAFFARARFCSNACEQKAKRAGSKTASGVCAQCSTPFIFFKYKAQECCSRGCAIRRRLGQPPTHGRPPVPTKEEQRLSYKDRVAQCLHCGAAFTFDRHAKKVPQACSAKCRMARRWGHPPTLPVEEQLW